MHQSRELIRFSQVVDSGGGVSSAVAVVDGVVVDRGWHYSALCGDSVSDHLHDLIQAGRDPTLKQQLLPSLNPLHCAGGPKAGGAGDGFANYTRHMERALVREVKETLCELPGTIITKDSQVPGLVTRLPDGNEIELQAEVSPLPPPLMSSGAFGRWDSLARAERDVCWPRPQRFDAPELLITGDSADGSVSPATVARLAARLPRGHHCSNFDTLPLVLHTAIAKCGEAIQHDLCTAVTICGPPQRPPPTAKKCGVLRIVAHKYSPRSSKEMVALQGCASQKHRAFLAPPHGHFSATRGADGVGNQAVTRCSRVHKTGSPRSSSTSSTSRARTRRAAWSARSTSPSASGPAGARAPPPPASPLARALA